MQKTEFVDTDEFQVITREVIDNQLVETMEMNGVRAIRTYKRIE